MPLLQGGLRYNTTQLVFGLDRLSSLPFVSSVVYAKAPLPSFGIRKKDAHTNDHDLVVSHISPGANKAPAQATRSSSLLTTTTPNTTHTHARELRHTLCSTSPDQVLPRRPPQNAKPGAFVRHTHPHINNHARLLNLPHIKLLAHVLRSRGGALPAFSVEELRHAERGGKSRPNKTKTRHWV